MGWWNWFTTVLQIPVKKSKSKVYDKCPSWYRLVFQFSCVVVCSANSPSFQSQISFCSIWFFPPGWLSFFLAKVTSCFRGHNWVISVICFIVPWGRRRMWTKTNSPGVFIVTSSPLDGMFLRGKYGQVTGKEKNMWLMWLKECHKPSQSSP